MELKFDTFFCLLLVKNEFFRETEEVKVFLGYI